MKKLIKRFSNEIFILAKTVKLTVNIHYGCRFLQSCCKPCHLLVYFAENLVAIYSNNAKDILDSFLDFAVDSKDIDKNITIIFESSFVTGIEKAHSLLKKFCFTAAFYELFDYFVPVVDFNCNCFKLVNAYYLEHIKEKTKWL